MHHVLGQSGQDAKFKMILIGFLTLLQGLKIGQTMFTKIPFKIRHDALGLIQIRVGQHGGIFINGLSGGKSADRTKVFINI